MVIGMVNDKNHDAVLKLLPKKAQYYFTKANIPRALEPDILQKKAKDYGLSGNVFMSVKEAFKEAKRNAKPLALAD
jgi:dihydrofolate synthase/folylpolyglutamate synthase